MKRPAYAMLAFALISMTTTFALAQPPGGGRGGPPQGGRGGPQPNPLLDALDTNGNGELSATEIENAIAALKGLDKNGDGKLSDADMMAGERGGQRGGPGGRGAGRRGQGGQGGAGGRGQGGQGGPGGRGPGKESRGQGQSRDAASAFLATILAFDKNEDGNVSSKELPERMQGVLETHDTNKDGILDRAELEQVAAARSESGGSQGGGPEPGGGPGEGGPGGPPSPERFVEHAMSFDSNDDGKLSKDELRKFAEEVGQRGPPGQGGPGGPGGR